MNDTVDYSRIIAVILGGGKGERLYPLTAERAKPAVPIAGNYRIIDIPVSNCIHSRIQKMFILTQFNSASLNRHVNSAYRFDTYSQGFIEILAAEQSPDNLGWFRGTADAVRQMKKHIRHHHPDYVLILSGDQLYSMNFRALLSGHATSGADLTVATLPVTREDAKGFGLMKIDDQGLIHTFKEKPKEDKILDEMRCSDEDLTTLGYKVEPGKNYLASMGIYVFNADYILNEALEDPENTDFGKNIIPGAIKDKKVHAYLHKGYWEDVGTIKSYFKASLEMTSNYPAFDIYEKNTRIFTNPRNLPPAKFCECTIKNSIVSPGVILEKVNVLDSIVGLRSVIGQGTVLERTIMLGSDWYDREAPGDSSIRFGIGKNCYIKEAIIEKNCYIGDNVKITNEAKVQNFETDTYCIREGIVITKKDVEIPDNTVI